MIQLRDQADFRQRAGLGIEAERFDVLFAGADKNDFLLGMCGGRRKGQSQGERRECAVKIFHIMGLD